MDAIERAVPSPQVKITVHRAARRQILWDRSPLATAAQHVHQTIDHLTHIHRALVAASLGWRNLPLPQPPFLIGQIPRIAEPASGVTTAVLLRSHGRPFKSDRHP